MNASALQDAFVAAARDGGLREVLEHIEAGANVNAPNSGGGYALCLAALSGHTAVVEALLEAGAATAPMAGAKPALSEAATRGHVDVVSTLLRAGAPVDARDSNGQTALHWSVAYDRRATAALLLEHGANPRVMDSFGNTPIEIATQRELPELLTLLEGHQPT